MTEDLNTEDAAKVVTVRISAGSEDQRTIEEFVSDIKNSLVEVADAKSVTTMGEYYLIDGQPIRPDGRHFLSGREDTPTDNKKATKKKATKKKATRDAEHKERKEEKEEEEGDPSVTEDTEEAPWCNHDASYLLPGDTCECGEVVPSTCDTCGHQGPVEEMNGNQCSRCYEPPTQDKEDSVRKIAAKTMQGAKGKPSMRRS